MSPLIVSLVGAGPGDPGLITVAGRERLRSAEVVVYDRLVAPALLKEVPAEADRIYVGKEASAHSVLQDQIAELLVQKASAGKRVVRLKGGDPFVFGRGGEEAEALVAAGLDFEVIPGVTSAIAAAAYAGIPVTHRALASSFTVLTGHEDDAKSESSIDWGAVARGADTLVVLMGRRTMAATVQRLIAEGRAADTPAAAIEWGTTPRQRVVTAPLQELPAAADATGLEPPVAVVIGDVVALRDRIGWFEQRPLFGKRVLVTRTRRQASALVQRLQAAGAEPLEMPAIEIEPLRSPEIDAAVDRLRTGDYDWAVFTSANGVRLFFDRLLELGGDARAFAGTALAVIGAETARALRAYGLEADLMPEAFVAESLLDAFNVHELEAKSILLARAREARAVLPRGLAARGAAVDDVPLYETRTPLADEAVLERLQAREIDVATFTASSTVSGCLELLAGRGELLDGVFIACIGPITAQTARDAGLQVELVSETHTIDGLVEALADHFAADPASPRETERSEVPHA